MLPRLGYFFKIPWGYTERQYKQAEHYLLVLRNGNEKLSIFNKQFRILNKVLHLGKEVIMEEDMLRGDSYKNLQSYAYILELNIEMLQKYVKDVIEI